MTEAIIVCRECGQVYDPGIERGTFLRRGGRSTGKKTRVGAQDVRTPGHRSGPRHAMFAEVTQRVRAGLALIDVAPWEHDGERYGPRGPNALRADAKVRSVPLTQSIAYHNDLWFVEAEQLEHLAVECDAPGAKEFAARVLTACAIVRAHPESAWWSAWLQANGVPGDAIAQGIRVNVERRFELWLGYEFVPGATDTLRGLR